mgnify:FL=1
MEHIAQKLRKAYDLIVTADNTDIDAYYLAVEEALGYIADELDICDSPSELTEPFFVDDGKSKFYIDSEEVSCEKFNEYFYAHDVGWEEDCEQQHTGTYTIYKIYRDDERS